MLSVNATGSTARTNPRWKRELDGLLTDPPPHCTVWADEEKTLLLHAELDGPLKSPYEGGLFKLLVKIPERYPFEPPQVQFQTKIYHPNIDAMGRICSDVLKMPPKGCWKPTLNLKVVLSALHIMLSEPNPDDPLEHDIAGEYKNNHSLYFEKAAEMTRLHAVRKAPKREAEHMPDMQKKTLRTS